MDFTQIAIVGIDGEAAETVGDLFNRYGYGGAVIESLAPNFDKVTVRTVIPREDQHKLRQIEAMLTLIGKALPHGLPAPKLSLVGESDWAASWKEHFHVVKIGRNFIIKPGWRDYTPAEDDLVIEIDPGLAFGSGLHPTTQLCLKLFEDMPLAKQEIFDVGTGSGILSIAALKLGAAHIRAVDIDDVAVRVADENFELNGYPPQPDPPQEDVYTWVETAVGSAENTGGRQWPIVVANILAHILIKIMPGLTAALAPGGTLILSGMIGEQEADVRAAAEMYGLQIVNRRQEEDWIALVAAK